MNARRQRLLKVATAWIEVWDVFEQACGQRMVLLGSEPDRLRKPGELRGSEAVVEQSMEASASMIDSSAGTSACKSSRRLTGLREPLGISAGKAEGNWQTAMPRSG
jgi:hypothetical protein